MPVPQAAEQAEALSRSLLDSLQNTGEAPQQALEQLCALATADDPAAARAASVALFRNIVEPLADSFDPAMDTLYLRFFSGVIDYCRRQPSFRAVDGQLRESGLKTKQQLLERAARLRNPQRHTSTSIAAGKRVKTVLVPSRVTLGADVAVTSVILRRMKAMFPNAQMLLFGSAKAGSLFASDPRVGLVETEYPRRGTLGERLQAWVALGQSVAKHLAGLMPDEYVIIDPDSRLTQLGLLPLESNDAHYCFFASRSYSVSGAQPLALSTGCWLCEVFGPSRTGPGQATRRPARPGWESGYRPEYPYVALPPEDVARGQALTANVRGRLAAVNLGVGGNADKRVKDPFEAQLLLSLLKAGYTLVLDRGTGEEELERSGRLIGEMQSQGKRVHQVPAAGCGASPADVFVWQGSLSGFGGLIAVADLYCGYDSAGGHLAAAMGVPVIDVFTDAAPPRLRESWTPWGEGAIRVVTARRLAPDKALREFRAALREQAR